MRPEVLTNLSELVSSFALCLISYFFVYAFGFEPLMAQYEWISLQMDEQGFAWFLSTKPEFMMFNLTLAVGITANFGAKLYFFSKELRQQYPCAPYRKKALMFGWAVALLPLLVTVFTVLDNSDYLASSAAGRDVFFCKMKDFKHEEKSYTFYGYATSKDLCEHISDKPDFRNYRKGGSGVFFSY